MEKSDYLKARRSVRDMVRTPQNVVDYLTENNLTEVIKEYKDFDGWEDHCRNILSISGLNDEQIHLVIYGPNGELRIDTAEGYDSLMTSYGTAAISHCVSISEKLSNGIYEIGFKYLFFDCDGLKKLISKMKLKETGKYMAFNDLYGQVFQNKKCKMGYENRGYVGFMLGSYEDMMKVYLHVLKIKSDYHFKDVCFFANTLGGLSEIDYLVEEEMKKQNQ